MAISDPTVRASAHENDLARRVAIQHESAEYTNRARAYVGDTLDGPSRVAALLERLALVGEEVALAPSVLPRAEVLALLGHCEAWIEAADREAAR